MIHYGRSYEKEEIALTMVPEGMWWLAIAGQAARLYLGGIFHRLPPLYAPQGRIVESELVPQ